MFPYKPSILGTPFYGNRQMVKWSSSHWWDVLVGLADNVATTPHGEGSTSRDGAVILKGYNMF